MSSVIKIFWVIDLWPDTAGYVNIVMGFMTRSACFFLTIEQNLFAAAVTLAWLVPSVQLAVGREEQRASSGMPLKECGASDGNTSIALGSCNQLWQPCHKGRTWDIVTQGNSGKAMKIFLTMLHWVHSAMSHSCQTQTKTDKKCIWRMYDQCRGTNLICMHLDCGSKRLEKTCPGTEGTCKLHPDRLHPTSRNRSVKPGPFCCEDTQISKKGAFYA